MNDIYVHTSQAELWDDYMNEAAKWGSVMRLSFQASSDTEMY